MSRQPATRALLDLARVLKDRGIRWYLFGAQAVVLWGAPRFSADVDVTVEVVPEESPALVLALEKSGFRLRVQDATGFVERTRVLPFVHLTSSIPVDVVLAGPGLEERFLERACSVRIGDAEIPVISPEDLLVTKILAGRSKDLEDIRGILRERRDELDLDQVRETLGLLEQALGQSDLLPVLEAELRRLGGG